MRQRCVLCGYNKVKVTYFRFPNNPDLLSLWAKYCGMEIEHVLPSYKLCSMHFTDEDLIDNRAGGGLLKLKKNQIPTVILTKRRSRKDQCPIDIHVDSSFNSREEVVENIIKNPTISTTVSDSNTENRCNENALIVPVTISDTSNDRSPPANKRQPAEMEHDVITFSTPTKKSRFETPRYIGDITSHDVVTPRKAKRNLMLSKKNLSKLKLKIRTLQQKNRRLTKKVKSLKDCVGHLRKKNLITEDAEDTLLVLPRR